MSDDLSFAGSCERDLLASKIWLCNELPKNNFKSVYVLGSWYGNMGLTMRFIGIDFKKLYNVDTNKRYCSANQRLYKLAKFDRDYCVINNDCNSLNFDDAELVINTSTNDIKSTDWFDAIPHNCYVALQCRNKQPTLNYKSRPDSFKEFIGLYPLSKVHYTGVMPLGNIEGVYKRYMIIGRK